MSKLFFASAVALVTLSSVVQAQAVEFHLDGGVPVTVIAVPHEDFEDNGGAANISIEFKNEGSNFFPYAFAGGWRNDSMMYLPGEGRYTAVIGAGVGYRTNGNPQPGDVYLQANVGLGVSSGREYGRFSGGAQMFQVRGTVVYQADNRLSFRAGGTHYSNGEVFFRPNQSDMGEDFLTLGASYMF